MKQITVNLKAFPGEHVRATGIGEARIVEVTTRWTEDTGNLQTFYTVQPWNTTLAMSQRTVAEKDITP